MATFHFELVSPERLLLSEMVEMVVIPGTEGNFGVLPGHAPLISTIRPGMIEVYEGGTVRRRSGPAKAKSGNYPPDRDYSQAWRSASVSPSQRRAIVGRPQWKPCR